MNIWEIDKLILFLYFFVPGFISIKVYDLIIPSERRDFSKSILEAVAFSAINFAALAWLLNIIYAQEFYENYNVWFYVFLTFILFIAPIIWPVILLNIRKISFIAKYTLHPIEKPWDYVFYKKEAYWIIIHLKNGTRIGGRFDNNSFASSSPSREQIYIEEVWNIDEDGKFIKPIERSKGFLILGEEILGLEFFQ